MDERRYSIFIGAFVAGGVLVAVAAALFFGGAGFGGHHQRVVMAFDGSVKGLTVGAPVSLRGVQIGQVTDIRAVLDLDAPDITMVVEADLEDSVIHLQGSDDPERARRELVTKGLRAQLNMQSVLTGLLYIQLDFHPGTEAEFVELDERYPQIPTIPTELQQLRQTLQSVDYAAMAAAIQGIAEGVRSLVEDENIRALPAELRATLAALEGAGARVDDSLAQLQPALGGTLSAVSAAAEKVNTSLPELSGQLGDALVKLDGALGETSSAMRGLSRQLGPGSTTLQQVNATLLELSRASRALQALLRTIEDQPDALLRGRRKKQDPS